LQVATVVFQRYNRASLLVFIRSSYNSTIGVAEVSCTHMAAIKIVLFCTNKWCRWFTVLLRKKSKSALLQCNIRVQHHSGLELPLNQSIFILFSSLEMNTAVQT